ncbi:MAG: hypothetical protein ACRCX2_15655 [Paraclostridium sp.]
MYNINSLYKFKDEIDIAFRGNDLKFYDSYDLSDIIDGTIGLEFRFPYFKNLDNYLNFTSLVSNTIREYIIDSRLKVDAMLFYLCDTSRHMDNFAIALATLLAEDTSDDDKTNVVLFIIKMMERYFELVGDKSELGALIVKLLVSISKILDSLVESGEEFCDFDTVASVHGHIFKALNITNLEEEVVAFQTEFIDMIYDDLDQMDFKYIPDLETEICSTVEAIFRLLHIS